MKQVTIFLLATMLLLVPEAQAFVVYGTQERIVPTEPPAGKGYQNLGYFYKRFRVYFIPIWRYGGKYVMYSGASYRELSASELAGYQRQLGRITPNLSFWDRFVNWIVVGVPTGIIVCFILYENFRPQEVLVGDRQPETPASTDG